MKTYDKVLVVLIVSFALGLVLTDGYGQGKPKTIPKPKPKPIKGQVKPPIKLNSALKVLDNSL